MVLDYIYKGLEIVSTIKRVEALVAINGTINLMPTYLVKLLELVWRAGTRSSRELQWLDTDEMVPG